MTDTRLYGRTRIVEFVGKALKRKGVPAKPLPIVLLTGPRGSGGSVLLSRIWREFSPDCLGVRLDLKAAQGVEDIVLAAVQGMGRKVHGIREVGFPRMGMLLKALSFEDGGGGRPAFEAYLRAGPREAADNSSLDDWAARAAPLMSPEQQVLLRAVAKLLGTLRSAVGRSQEAKARQWLADYGSRSMGGGYDSLWELYRLHHGHTDGTDTPRPVAKTLCAAFLADLRADFNDSPLLHGQRPRNCLLLLDNAGGRAGDLFLELLAECRREHGTAACDPAVVVAVQRGRVRHRTTEPLEPTDERLDFDVRHPGAPADEDHPVWWYPVRLADLDKESVAELSRSGVLGTRNRDADFLYALTGGHPESAARLARLLARLGRTSPYDPRLLLGERELPGEGGPDSADDTVVEEYLLRRTLADDLVPGPDGGIPAGDNPMLDAMAVLAVTPGLRRGACNAALQYLGRDEVDADTAQRRLTSAMWLDETPDGEAARLHPLIALLLRRRLARKPEAWRGAHLGYAAHYSRRQDAAVRHHHTLALVEPSQRQPLGTVVGFLEEEWERCGSTQDWLRVLDQVTAAPNRLRTTLDPRSFVTSLAGVAGARSRHQTVTRLTVARWLFTDRYFDPAHRLAQTIANEYEDLANGTDDNEVLFQQAGKYRRIENDWKD